MFCRLWKIQSVVPKIKFDGVNKHCSDNGCIHIEKIKKKLSSDHFGWICSEQIFLDDVKSEQVDEYKYCYNFIHPVEEDLWVFINPDKEPFDFRIFCGNIDISGSGIGDLNEKLKQKFSYDGIWITEETLLHGFTK